MDSNFEKAIDELLNRLDDEETNLKKITDVTHNILMTMSYKKAMVLLQIRKKVVKYLQ